MVDVSRTALPHWLARATHSERVFVMQEAIEELMP